MNAYEALEFSSYAFTLGANVVVAGVCFAAFRKRRIPALLLLAISASIAVFSIFSETLLLWRTQDDSTYAFLWTGITVLRIVDIGLYTFGVAKLVAWIPREKPGEQAGDRKPDHVVS
jgi:uncharacterized membrane protein